MAKSKHSWLRAAVLGANDGILSTSGLLVGVSAANQSPAQIVVIGSAGLVAGALAMAAGEYVSVSSQADVERADLARERHELRHKPEEEHAELTQIYVDRGLDRALAAQVADQLTAHDALGAHARDELGINERVRARPLQAALASATSYSTGATLPLVTASLATGPSSVYVISAASLLALGGLGALAAFVGGAGVLKGAGRVTFWGALAMAVTGAVGHVFGAS